MTFARTAVLAVATALCLALLNTAALAQGDDLQEANQLFKQGQLDRALDRVNTYLSTHSKDARGRFLQGLILTEQNKSAEAIKVFTALTEDYPELPEPYNNLAVLYASQGQYDKARTALEMAIRTHPSYATAHENLGDIYAKMASQAYDKALQLDNNNATAKTKLNLIKELFSSSPRVPKMATGKSEPPAKVAAAPAAKASAPPSSPPPVVATVKPATPKPVASKPAAPEKPESRPATDNAEAVLKAVNGWARAWSDNDVSGYLAHYAPDFKTPRGENRSTWEAQRRARIAKPRDIQVDVESPKVAFSDQARATVTFRQRYRSNTFKATSTKTLVMVKSGDKWLIQQEQVGG